MRDTDRRLVGMQDLLNPLFEVGRRSLPPDYLALILQDAYGYEVTQPQSHGTFYAILTEGSGELLVRGNTSSNPSNDAFRISRAGEMVRISVDIGVDTPGSGPNGDASELPEFVTDFSLNAVTSIVVQGGSGQDSLYVDFSGGDP